MTAGRLSTAHGAAILAGGAAAAGSFALRAAQHAEGGGLYQGIDRFELLSHFCLFGLLAPGLALLAWGLAPLRPRPAVARRTDRRTWLALLVLLALGWAAEARFLRWYWLEDRPATAAEGALAFGGKLWATGTLASPAFDPGFGFDTRGLARVGLEMYPAENPGALLVAAAAEKTGLGHLLYALLSAAAGLALTLACGRLAGKVGLAVAAILWTCSPMLSLLAISASGDLLARSWLAFAIACWLVLATGAGRDSLLAGGLGMTAALALATRPIEALCLLLPIAVHLGLMARRGELPVPAMGLAAIVAALGPLALWLYQRRLEGVPLGDGGGDLAAVGSYALLLIFYFAGPLILPLLALAGWRGGAVVTVAASGLLLSLLRPLFGAGDGAHVFGPQAGAAAALPLLLLAALGCAELARRLAAAGLSARPWAAAGLGWLAALLLFLPIQGEALLDRTDFFRALERAAATPEPAIVLVEPVQALGRLRPSLLVQDNWRGELPHPDPWLRDRVTFADAAIAEPARLRRAFPKRRLYLLRVTAGPELYQLEPLP